MTESGKHQLWYGNYYAAQTFSNTPDDRRIQTGWGRGTDFPGMPFNQQMMFPCRLTLRTTPDGVRLFAEPVREVESLRRQKRHCPCRGTSFSTETADERGPVLTSARPRGGSPSQKARQIRIIYA